MESGRDMVSSELIASLSPDKLKQIRLFCDVAEANGDHMTLKELISLISLNVTESELSENWGVLDGLKGYSINSGLVTKAKLDSDSSDAETVAMDRINRARRNIQFSRSFAELCSTISLKVLSISGSTSYLSVAKDGDLDLFCIMNKDSLWPSLVKFLLLARIFRLVHRDSPSICLSYVVDESFALREFSQPHDGLFARDAIYSRVLRGEPYYARLLRSSHWMAEYFPKLYDQRVKQVHEGLKANNESSTSRKIANLFVYIVASSYIRMKSQLLNRRYSREGKLHSSFRTLVGKDHCIYESVRYLDLRQMYKTLDSIDDVSKKAI